MNYMDIATIVIFAVFGYFGFKTGFTKMALHVVSQFAVIILTYMINPIFSKMLRSTPIFDTLKDSIISNLGIDNIADQVSRQAQTSLINSLQLPDFLKTALFDNNNPQVYKVLDVNAVSDYIGGYLANIIINIISFIIIYLAFTVFFIFISKSLKIVSKLPIIKHLNKTLGLAAGLLQGLIVIWVLFVILTMLLPKQSTLSIFNELSNSIIAIKLYDSNILLNFILQVFG